LEEIENVDDFVGRLERIELPNQVISALSDSLFQKYLFLKPSETASKRLNQWLSTFFDEELHLLSHGQYPNKRLSEMLEKLLNYTRYTKVLPQPILAPNLITNSNRHYVRPQKHF